MRFDPDIQILEQTVRHRDPSFRLVDPSLLAAHLAALQDAQLGNETFLLAAMRLMALSGNGHSRVLPHLAIQTLPLRFLALAGDIILTRGEEQANGTVLQSVNGVPVSVLCDAARPYLSGTPQRQCALAPMLMAWPAALREIGVDLSAGHVAYGLAKADGSSLELACSIDGLVPAVQIYPIHETGSDESTAPHLQVMAHDAQSLHIRLHSLKDVPTAAIQAAISKVEAVPKFNLVFDLRGNPGGSFFHPLPLIDSLATRWRGERCVVLVDKFTFSAAIVCVALLIHRLGDRAVVMGEAMGDGLRFFAEGGTDPLPASKSQLRYSDALHDWETGIGDATTPPEIADKLVGVGPPNIIPIAVSAHDMWAGLDPMLNAALNALHT